MKRDGIFVIATSERGHHWYGYHSLPFLLYYPFHFWVLEESDLQSVGLSCDDSIGPIIKEFHKVTGKKIVVYDPVVTQPRIVENESESAGEFKDSVDMVVENVVEKPPLNDHSVVEDIDE